MKGVVWLSKCRSMKKWKWREMKHKYVGQIISNAQVNKVHIWFNQQSKALSVKEAIKKLFALVQETTEIEVVLLLGVVSFFELLEDAAELFELGLADSLGVGVELGSVGNGDERGYLDEFHWSSGVLERINYNFSKSGGF